MSNSWPESYKMLAEAHISTAALRIAEDQLEKGVQEVTENWGPMIEEYLRAAGISRPAAWCAAFVNWCAEEAAGLVGSESPLEAVEQQALVQSYFEWSKASDRLVSPPHVGLGDLFLVYFPSRGTYNHIGFVRDPNPHGDYTEFTTVEGNTNDSGGREGYKVASRTRRYRDYVTFIRW